MPRWSHRVVARVRRLAEAGKIRFTSKAVQEIAALGVPLSIHDCRVVMMGPIYEESVTRVRSKVSPEWLYVFRPWTFGALLYVKVALRDECVVISFHEEEPDDAR